MVAASTLVPKGPLIQRDAEFDRDAILAKLFALPVPPNPAAGSRTYPIHTPLGRIMRLRGLTIREVDAGEGCPNYRLLSDYLAGRKPVGPQFRGALARLLQVDPRIF